MNSSIGGNVYKTDDDDLSKEVISILGDMLDLARKLPVGVEAPDFTLEDLDGKQVSLKDFVGKELIVLEFGSFT